MCHKRSNIYHVIMVYVIYVEKQILEKKYFIFLSFTAIPLLERALGLKAEYR